MTIRETPWNLEFYGDSSEGLPTQYQPMYGDPRPIPEASTLYFSDKQKLYMWNTVKNAWIEQ